MAILAPRAGDVAQSSVAVHTQRHALGVGLRLQRAASRSKSRKSAVPGIEVGPVHEQREQEEFPISSSCNNKAHSSRNSVAQVSMPQACLYYK